MAQFVPQSDPELDSVALVEQLGASVAARYAAIELRMIEVVADVVRRGLVVDMTRAERLTMVDRLRRYGKNLATVAMTPDAAESIIREALEGGATAAINRLGVASVTGSAATAFTTSAEVAIAALAVDLTNRLDAMEHRITRWMPDVYQRIIGDEAATVLAGVDDLRLAKRRAAQKLLGEGVDGFTDKAGRKWRIGTYAEMATRTAVHRAYIEGNTVTMERLADLHLVTIVARANSCKECHAQAGRIYSTDGTSGAIPMPHAIEDDRVVIVNVEGGLDKARSQGWDHPNCTCSVVAYQPGLNAPGYLVAGQWSEQRAKDRDRLRTLERRMRDLRRQKAAAMTPAERKRLTVAIKRQDERIAAHVAGSAEPRRRARESVTFADGRGGAATLPAIPRGL